MPFEDYRQHFPGSDQDWGRFVQACCQDVTEKDPDQDLEEIILFFVENVRGMGRKSAMEMLAKLGLLFAQKGHPPNE